MIPIYRRYYRAGPRAVAATGKTILVYDVPADAVLSVWDAVLISESLAGVTQPAHYQSF